MAEVTDNRYCPGCGTDVPDLKARFCPKCAKRVEFAGKLAQIFEPQNAEGVAALKQFLNRVSHDSLMAMVSAVAGNDFHNAAIECGVYQNASSIFTLIQDEINWVLEISSKPEGES